jgi:hypothetical protein
MMALILGYDLATASAGAGLLLGQLPGTMQAHSEGSMALPVQMGFAAMAGLRAADLAAPHQTRSDRQLRAALPALCGGAHAAFGQCRPW